MDGEQQLYDCSAHFLPQGYPRLTLRRLRRGRASGALRARLAGFDHKLRVGDHGGSGISGI
jgi:hypothetical protein